MTQIAVGCAGCTLPFDCPKPADECDLIREAPTSYRGARGVSSQKRAERVTEAKRLFRDHTVAEIADILQVSERVVYLYLE